MIILILGFGLYNLHAQGTLSGGNGGGTLSGSSNDNNNTHLTDCERYHIGSLNVTNNTNSDIYFYYIAWGRDYTVYSHKIKVHESLPIGNLYSSWPRENGGARMEYRWVASNDFYETGTPLNQMKGFANDAFYVSDCQVTSLPLNN